MYKNGSETVPRMLGERCPNCHGLLQAYLNVMGMLGERSQQNANRKPNRN